MHAIDTPDISRTIMTIAEADHIAQCLYLDALDNDPIAKQFIAMVDQAKAKGWMDVRIQFEEYVPTQLRRPSVKWTHVTLNDSRSMWHFSSMHQAAVWLLCNHYTTSSIKDIKAALSRHVNKSTTLLGFSIKAEREPYDGIDGHYESIDRRD